MSTTDTPEEEFVPDPADASHLVINCTSGESGRADTHEDRERLTAEMEQRVAVNAALAEQEAIETRAEHARLQVIAQRRELEQRQAAEELRARADAGDVNAELTLRLLGLHR